MSFFKHVGVANGKKVIIVQRSLPNEEHMAAVMYSDILPSKYHDDIMKVLESPEGQAAYEFRDILQRRMSSNGSNLLEACSSEGYLKRVSCNAVIVKPNSKSSIRLDELNTLLNQVGRGEQAVKKLEALYAQQGMADPGKYAYDPNTIEPDQLGETYIPNQTAPSVNIPPAPAATTPTSVAAPDMTQLMMQMMQTMQAMQNEIKGLKGGDTSAEPKRGRGRPPKAIA